MSTATKRGKLLPDLLVAREAALPGASHEPTGGGSAPFAALEAPVRSRPGILDWILVKRIDLAADVATVRQGSARVPAEAMFCEKGNATPAASRPWRWDYETLAEASLKRAPCGGRAKAKPRRNAR